MSRLTKKDNKGNWHIFGIPWEQIPGVLYGALCKLKAYEDTGLTPQEVEELNTFDGSQAMIATAKLQKEQRKHCWISVDERLPEDMEEVLVSDNCGRIYLTEYEDGYGFDDVDGVAWMPLPEPYSPY